MHSNIQLLIILLSILLIIILCIRLQYSREIYIISWITNIVLLQQSASTISFFDAYSSVNFQCTKFNPFTSLFINITEDLVWVNSFFGCDRITLIFIILTIFLISCALSIGSNSVIFGSTKLFVFLIQFIELMLIIAFFTTDLFIFYLAFEGLAVPTFFLIYIYGAEITKLRAAKFFLVYSFLSSTLLSIAIIELYTHFKTTSLNQLIVKIPLALHYNNSYTTTIINDVPLLSYNRYIFIYLLLFLGFGIKVPLVPFHMWLPEAHAEASTAGSVILAGLILKLGGYGIFRFMLPIYGGFTFFNPYIQTTCIVGICYTLLCCTRTTNLKQIIAYSSIIHMNTVTLGLFSNQTISLVGSILSMLSHSLVSSGLFICAGILYSRIGSYEIHYLSGLNQSMPIFSTFFMILWLSNASLPLTFPFVGEFLIFIGLSQTNFTMFVVLLVFYGYNIVYTLWLLNRIVYSDITANINLQIKLIYYQDLTIDEFAVLFCIISLILLFGIAPNILIDLLLN